MRTSLLALIATGCLGGTVSGPIPIIATIPMWYEQPVGGNSSFPPTSPAFTLVAAMSGSLPGGTWSLQNNAANPYGRDHTAGFAITSTGALQLVSDQAMLDVACGATRSFFAVCTAGTTSLSVPITLTLDKGQVLKIKPASATAVTAGTLGTPSAPLKAAGVVPNMLATDDYVAGTLLAKPPNIPGIDFPVGRTSTNPLKKAVTFNADGSTTIHAGLLALNTSIGAGAVSYQAPVGTSANPLQYTAGASGNYVGGQQYFPQLKFALAYPAASAALADYDFSGVQLYIAGTGWRFDNCRFDGSAHASLMTAVTQEGFQNNQLALITGATAAGSSALVLSLAVTPSPTWVGKNATCAAPSQNIDVYTNPWSQDAKITAVDTTANTMTIAASFNNPSGSPVNWTNIPASLNMSVIIGMPEPGTAYIIGTINDQCGVTNSDIDGTVPGYKFGYRGLGALPIGSVGPSNDPAVNPIWAATGNPYMGFKANRVFNTQQDGFDSSGGTYENNYISCGAFNKYSHCDGCQILHCDYYNSAAVTAPLPGALAAVAGMSGANATDVPNPVVIRNNYFDNRRRVATSALFPDGAAASWWQTNTTVGIGGINSGLFFEIGWLGRCAADITGYGNVIRGGGNSSQIPRGDVDSASFLQSAPAGLFITGGTTRYLNEPISFDTYDTLPPAIIAGRVYRLYGYALTQVTVAAVSSSTPGFAVGDILVRSSTNGTKTAIGGTDAVLKVTSVDGTGKPLGVVATNPGSYSVLPTLTFVASTGSGQGTVTVSRAGNCFVLLDTVTGALVDTSASSVGCTPVDDLGGFSYFSQSTTCALTSGLTARVVGSTVTFSAGNLPPAVNPNTPYTLLAGNVLQDASGNKVNTSQSMAGCGRLNAAHVWINGVIAVHDNFMSETSSFAYTEDNPPQTSANSANYSFIDRMKGTFRPQLDTTCWYNNVDTFQKFNWLTTLFPNGGQPAFTGGFSGPFPTAASFTYYAAAFPTTAGWVSAFAKTFSGVAIPNGTTRQSINAPPGTPATLTVDATSGGSVTLAYTPDPSGTVSADARYTATGAGRQNDSGHQYMLRTPSGTGTWGSWTDMGTPGTAKDGVRSSFTLSSLASGSYDILVAAVNAWNQPYMTPQQRSATPAALSFTV